MQGRPEAAPQASSWLNVASRTALTAGVDVHVSNFAFMGGNDTKLGDDLEP